MKKIVKYVIAAVVIAWIGYLVYNSLQESNTHKADPFGMTTNPKAAPEDNELKELQKPENLQEPEQVHELSANEIRKNVIELKEGIRNDSTIVFRLAANDSPASVEWRTQDNSTVVMWRSANNELYQLIAPIHNNWNPGPANTVLTFANGKKLRVMFEKSGEIVELGRSNVEQAVAQVPAKEVKSKRHLNREERETRVAKARERAAARAAARAASRK